MARLPRGLQTGRVPVGEVAITSASEAKSAIASKFSGELHRFELDRANAESSRALSHAQSASRDFVNKLSEATIDTESDRPMFEVAERRFEEFMGDMESSLHELIKSPRAQHAVQEGLKAIKNDMLVGVRATARSQMIDHTKTQNTAAIESYVQMGEFEAARLVLKGGAEYFTPRDTKKLTDFIAGHEQTALDESQVSRIVDEAMDARGVDGPEAAASFLRTLSESDELPEGFTQEQIDSGIDAALARLRRQDELDRRANANLETELRVERAIAINDFRQGIDSATSDADIDRFARRHAIADQSLIGSFYSERDKQRESISILESDYIDPTNKKVRDLVDIRIRNLAPKDPIGAAISIAADTGIASTSLEQYFEGGARSPRSFAEAATRYRMFRESAPNAYLPLSDDAKAVYSLAATLGRGGMNPVTAAEEAWDSVFNSTPEQRQARRNNYPAEEIVGYVIDDLNDIPGMHKPGFFVDSVAEVPLAMADDMNRIGLVSYEKHGSIDAAREAIRTNIVNAWQYTDVNEGVMSGEDELEPVYMKGAPRRGTDFVRKRLEEFFDNDGRLYFHNGEFKTIDASRVEIWSPPIPEANQFGQPVWVLRMDGIPLFDEVGNVLRWTYELPPGSERPEREGSVATEAGFIPTPVSQSTQSE